MKQYIILTESTPQGLAAAVNAMQQQGWSCQGGICFGYVNKALYMQAMVK